MAAYFRCNNVNREIAGVFFEPVGTLAGVMQGLYQTSDESQIQRLRALISAGKSGVEELSEIQYLQRLKKKRPELPPTRSVLVPPTVQPPVRLEERSAVVVADPESLVKQEPVDESSPDAFITVEKIEPSLEPVISVPPEVQDQAPDEKPKRRKRSES
jgi:hypothetical protein